MQGKPHGIAKSENSLGNAWIPRRSGWLTVIAEFLTGIHVRLRGLLLSLEAWRKFYRPKMPSSLKRRNQALKRLSKYLHADPHRLYLLIPQEFNLDHVVFR